MKNKITRLFLISFLVFGCSPSLNTIDSFETKASEHTVEWRNYDGSLLKTDNSVTEDFMPFYSGETPRREDDSEYEYIFNGWSPEISLIDCDTTYTATFSKQRKKYEIDFDLDGGTSHIYNGPIGVETFSADILFYDCKKEGWTFRGWLYNGVKISDEDGNIFFEPELSGNVTLKAIYDQKVKVKFVSQYDDYFEDLAQNEYQYNSEINFVIENKQYYTFDGWYIDSTCISNDLNLEYITSCEDIVFYARFFKVTYTIHYNLNGGSNSIYNPNSYSPLDSSIKLFDPTKKYHTFVKWVDDNGNLITEIKNFSEGDIFLNAIWSQTNEQLIEQTKDEIINKSILEKNCYSTEDFVEKNGVINYAGQWDAIDSNNYRHIIIPINEKKVIVSISVRSDARNNVYVVPVSELSVPKQDSFVDYKTSRWSKNCLAILIGETKEFVVPDDAKYLLISSYYAGDLIERICINKLTSDNSDSIFSGRINMCAMNVRGFGDGTTEGGMNKENVETSLLNWENFVEESLNVDFLSLTEWRDYFDEENTIDAYSKLFKPFYKYYFGAPKDNHTQMLFSKYNGVFIDLSDYAHVNRTIPCLVTRINNLSVAIVNWLQSSTDLAENRIKAYCNAINFLEDFDVVIAGGDFNTEEGLDELEIFKQNSYTLGNGGNWGVINTWPADKPRTPNDNIICKGAEIIDFHCIDKHLTSDHLPVFAEISF